MIDQTHNNNNTNYQYYNINDNNNNTQYNIINDEQINNSITITGQRPQDHGPHSCGGLSLANARKGNIYFTELAERVEYGNYVLGAPY